MPTGSDLVRATDSMLGKKYSIIVRFGPSYDCSGFIYIACQRVGVFIPASSWTQARWCRDHGTLISEAQFLKTPGALAFRGANYGYDGYGPSGHVFMSDGHGMTREARGKDWGTGSWGARGRGVNFGLIPGISYAAGTSPPPNTGDDDMPKPNEIVAALKQGSSVWRLQADGDVETIKGDKFWGSMGNVPAKDKTAFGYGVDITDRIDGSVEGYSIWGAGGGIFDFGPGIFGFK